MKELKKLELYFHIPFCIKKCLYCDFLSAPAGKKVQESYMEALLAEITEAAKKEECLNKYVVDTVFIGGGTPSAVDAVWIDKLLQTVGKCFTVLPEAEITIEVNPGTVDAGKLKCYRQTGINRLSIGLQSADNEELGKIGRIHTWEDFLETWRLAGEAGFLNRNVDVMSALPGQSLASYCRTLEKLLALTSPPEHISAYSLIVEEGTPFFSMQENGELPLPEEEEERLMYKRTADILGRAGYSRYEISNYAKTGYACRHNCGYWNRTDYLGFGIGAASLIDNVRFRNDDSLEAYLQAPSSRRRDIQILNVKEQMEEFMYLGLRMVQGVSEGEFQSAFGRKPEEVYGSVIRKNLADGLLEYRERRESKDRRIALTERGMDISNYVMAQFLFDEEA